MTKTNNYNRKSSKGRKIFLLSILGLFILFLIVAVTLKTIKAKKGLPDYTEDIHLKNLQSEVSVFRDEVGTPHIYASNEKDLYRTVGFLMAQDRMWQMDVLRRVTLGRLSEIFGSDYVETDLLLRSLRYSEKSKSMLEKSPEDIKLVLDAFSDGVNQYIEQYKGNYPVEFFLLGYNPEKWEPYQSLNLISFMAWDLKAGWNEIILDELNAKLDSAHYVELLPDIESYKDYVFYQKDHEELLASIKLKELSKLESLGVDILSGSNNWAVSGAKSETGMPIVANDMHLSLNVPGVWMQMHQVVDGKLNVSGLVLPGQPLVIVGHNDSIAWGMTNTYVDNLDYYQEKINPDDSNQYMYMGEWKDFEIVKEQILTREGDTVLKTYRRNHRGPVVSEQKDIKDKVLTIKWVGSEESNEFLSVLKANRAKNWQDFKDAFRTFRSISQNIVYGDVKGNIGLYACAGVPIRKRNAPFEILPGWTDEYEWKGLVPFDELPHEFNPERGYVSSANNRTTDSTYPYHIGSWYSLPYRIERIRELLEKKDKFNIDDFKQIQNDAKSKFSLAQVEQLFVLIDEEVLDKLESEVCAKLKFWDGNMDKELIEPTVAEAFNWMFAKQLYADEMGPDLFSRFEKNGKLVRIAIYNLMQNPDSPWIDNVNTEEKEDLKAIVNSTFKATMEYLVENYRSDTRKWKWKFHHTITLKHMLASKEALDVVFNLSRGPFAVNGAKHTVAPYSYPMFEPSQVNHGASHRHIFSIGNWDKSVSVIPTGYSGVITSRFYCNQTKAYVEGKYYEDLFSREIVESKSKYRISVLPE